MVKLLNDNKGNEKFLRIVESSAKTIIIKVELP